MAYAAGADVLNTGTKTWAWLGPYALGLGAGVLAFAAYFAVDIALSDGHFFQPDDGFMDKLPLGLMFAGRGAAMGYPALFLILLAPFLVGRRILARYRLRYATVRMASGIGLAMVPWLVVAMRSPGEVLSDWFALLVAAICGAVGGSVYHALSNAGNQP